MAETSLNVRYVADLARLHLTDAEADTFQKQLGEVLGYVEKLREVSVAGIDPAFRMGPLENNLRPDKPGDPLGAEKVLANAPQAANDLVVVPKIIE